MFLLEFKNTHIKEVPALIDKYRNRMDFDKQTYADNVIIDEQPPQPPDYELEINKLNYELEIWKKIPAYCLANNGNKYFTALNSEGKTEYRFTMYKKHFNQFLKRLKSFEKKYSVELSYEYHNFNPTTYDEYLVRIYDLVRV